jgi:hypothetical protein
MPCSSRTSNSAARDEREWTAPMRLRASRTAEAARVGGVRVRGAPEAATRAATRTRPPTVRRAVDFGTSRNNDGARPFRCVRPIARRAVDWSTAFDSEHQQTRRPLRVLSPRRAARPALHGARCPRDRSPRPWASAEPSRNGRRSTKSPACAVKVRARPPSFDARRRSARVRILFFFSGHEANAPTRRASFADKPSIASRPNPTCASRL